MENVVRLDQTMIEDLKKKRVLREREEAIELDPVGPGESMIGVLTEEERVVFTELYALTNDLDALSKELSARSLEMIADAMRKSDKMDQISHNMDLSKVFPTDDDAEEFFSLESRLEYLRAIYNTSLRDRYGHRAVYGVRSGFTVVRVAYKHKLPSDVRP
jgi:hypothetical protein